MSEPNSGPTRAQAVRFLSAFEAGPLDPEQRREARRQSGYAPTGGWFRGHRAHFLEWADSNHYRARLRPEARDWLAMCRARPDEEA